MRKRRSGGKGLAAAAFGAGLLLAVCMPAKVLVVLLAGFILVCGICLCKK